MLCNIYNFKHFWRFFKKLCTTSIDEKKTQSGDKYIAFPYKKYEEKYTATY